MGGENGSLHIKEGILIAHKSFYYPGSLFLVIVLGSGLYFVCLFAQIHSLGVSFISLIQVQQVGDVFLGMKSMRSNV